MTSKEAEQRSLVCDDCKITMKVMRDHKFEALGCVIFLGMHIGHNIRFLDDSVEDKKSENYVELT